MSGRHDASGAYVRQDAAFRQWVTADGSSGFRAEPDRYHLYVSLACPWAHRTILFRRQKRLEPVIGMTVVDPIRDERGWRFSDAPKCGPDPINGFEFLSEAYTATQPDFADRPTVPVLWDRQTQRIVNNESSEIIRMLNREFDEWGDAEVDYYPEPLRPEIDEINDWVYSDVNNGVYRTGFARRQKPYEEAFDRLFRALDRLEDRLATRRYLVGEQLTEADWRLFTTLLRFDPVYYVHFKCNWKRVIDYPALRAYLRRLYALPGVADTVDMDHIKRHYYVTHHSLNPSGIVARGPYVEPGDPR